MFGADSKTTYQGVTLKKPSIIGETYQISNREELLWWAVNDQNKSIRLTADINIQGNQQLLNDEGNKCQMNDYEIVVWPYVYYNSSCPTIDGNKHTIRGLYQNKGYGVDGAPGSSKNYDYVGFISYSKPTITIKDLTIEDSFFEGKVVGAFIGQKSKHATATSQTNITNCSFRGVIVGTMYAGGIVGQFRTDGQDANIYRCFNYGTVKVLSQDTNSAAGGICGYLDITHTAFAKANTFFNRCVNYGSITNNCPGGNVGGIIGRVWDNNNGEREYRFCFNFGDVTKYDQLNKKLTGSGIIGGYIHTNGKSKPKVLNCGNARKTDTGSLLDSLTWNVDGEKLLLSGYKVNLSNKLYSSIQKDESAITYFNNNWIMTSAITAIITVGVVTAGVALVAYEALSVALIAVFGTGALTALTAAFFEKNSAFSGGYVIGAKDGIGAAYNTIRTDNNAANLMAQAPLVYNDNDVRTATFAYDCNLMMQSDSIGGKLNDDKSILFEQHIDINDSTKNDRFPSIITDYSTVSPNTLHYGYDKCNPIPRTSNETNLLATPQEHTFDSTGKCTVCGLSIEPLGTVMKMDGDKEVVDYYTIKNQQQLNFLASVFNGENIDNVDEYYNLYNGATFKLLNDITFADKAMWEPIGSHTDHDATTNETSAKWHPFKGTFDGQGYTIKGLRTDENTNYAGLFGMVNPGSYIHDLTLSNCLFQGNVAGSIAGLVQSGDRPNGDFMPVSIDKVAADSSVTVTAVISNADSYAGGFIGIAKPCVFWNCKMTVTNCYSNASLNYVIKNDNGNDLKHLLGSFVGCYSATIWLISPIDETAVFENCYFGGQSISENLHYVGNIVKGEDEVKWGKDFHANRFVNCYSVSNNKKGTFDNVNGSSYFVPYNYMVSGHLAYDLMVSTSTNDKYLYTQNGNYPAFATNTNEPSLCNIEVVETNSKISLGDTIIIKSGKELKVPFAFAGAMFANATLAGWANDNTSTTPTETATENAFSMITAKPWYRYKLYVTAKDAPTTLDVYRADQLRGVPALGGSVLTNIMNDLYLTGKNEWTILSAPKTLEGNYHSIYTDMALMTETSQTGTDPIEIRNLRIYGDTLGTYLGRYNETRTIKLTNVIISYSSNFTFDNNRLTSLYTSGVVFSNAVAMASDSTNICFYQGSENNRSVVIYNDNSYGVNVFPNTYANILGYMLKHNMFDAFGLRLDGKDEKVAGKFGFATESDKRIYRTKLYDQATGEESGELLMNYDAKYTYKVNGETLGEMTQGVPAGCFAVLPVTKDELGDKFKSLGANVITKDGYAAIIRLVDSEIDGFAYPACFPNTGKDTDSFIITANRAEYVRNIRRNGLYESVYLPFAFTTLEFDDKEMSKDDKIEIAFLNAKEGDGLNNQGTQFRLTSLSSHYAKMLEQNTDPTTDEEDDLFIAGVPYFINLSCTDRTDETTEITFVGYNVGFLREPIDLYFTQPLYGSFSATTAANVNKGKVYVLGAFKDETTGKNIEKFVSVKDTYNLRAFRSYMALTKAVQSMRLFITGQDPDHTTGIDQISQHAKAEGKAYDILGRRINATNAKGVYIMNGKKIINLRK